MLIAIVHLRILFAMCKVRVSVSDLKPDGFLWTVVDARQTDIAISGCLNAFRCELVITARTDLGAGTATDAILRDNEAPLAPFQIADFRI